LAAREENKSRSVPDAAAAAKLSGKFVMFECLYQTHVPNVTLT